MRRVDRETLVVVGVVGCLILMFAGTLALGEADAQQSPGTAVAGSATTAASTDDRLSALETQVAVLQTRVAVLESGIGSSSADAAGTLTSVPVHTILFTLDLTGSDNFVGGGIGGICFGIGGYDDIGVGMAIIITDQSGTVIGTAFADSAEQTSIRTCRISAVIENVPEVPFYQVQASHRGAPSYSLQQMQDANWTIALTIGG